MTHRRGLPRAFDTADIWRQPVAWTLVVIDTDDVNISQLHALLGIQIAAGYGDAPIHVALLTEPELHDLPIKSLLQMGWLADDVRVVDEHGAEPFAWINAIRDTADATEYLADDVIA
jgi:hypothetical protein